MSHNLNELSSSVQNLGKQYAAVIKVGEFLASLGSLDNLACEIEARVEKAKQAEIKANEALSKVQAAVAEQAATHDSNIKVARERAEKIVADAQSRAATIVAEAEAKVVESNDEIARRTMHADQAFDFAKGELDALNVEIAKAEAVLKELNEKIEAVRARFA